MGDCYDNAAMEAFWATMKREITWLRGSCHFATRRKARSFLFEYIEIFYNRQRHQTGLGHLTPAEFPDQGLSMSFPLEEFTENPCRPDRVKTTIWVCDYPGL